MPHQKPVRQQLRILVVEDHDLLRRLFSEAFRDLHIVYTAGDAREGWKLYLDKTPEVVFLDIALPDASGHKLARQIKQRNPASYVIMATVSDCAEDKHEAARNNADGFIVKPFDKNKITGYIDRYLATHPLQS
jgi:DNA-binding response OmpR family regulator